MNEHQILGYIPKQTVIHSFNATAKLFFVLAVSFACMTTYDTRFLLVVGICSTFIFKLADLKWNQISFVIKFVCFFSVLNILAVFIFQPTYGQELYGAKQVLISAGYFTLTSQELFYLANVALKYFCTIPLTLGFILTTNPSAFAASLSKLKVSYKVSYAVSLALRYIPDIQADYFAISQAQQARGFEMSKKGKFFNSVKGALQIVLPLVFSSLERIETISTAMELRRFGAKKKRTWYVAEPFRTRDYLLVVSGLVLFIISLILFKVNGGRFYNPFK